jgi:hypothetical protein
MAGSLLGGIAFSILLAAGTALIQHQHRLAQAIYGQYAGR